MKIPLGKTFPIFFILLVVVLGGAIAEKLLWEGHLYPDFLISDAYVAKDTQLQASNDTTLLKQCYAQHLTGCEKYYRSFSQLEVGKLMVCTEEPQSTTPPTLIESPCVREAVDESIVTAKWDSNFRMVYAMLALLSSVIWCLVSATRANIFKDAKPPTR